MCSYIQAAPAYGVYSSSHVIRSQSHPSFLVHDSCSPNMTCHKIFNKSNIINMMWGRNCIFANLFFQNNTVYLGPMQSEIPLPSSGFYGLAVAVGQQVHKSRQKNLGLGPMVQRQLHQKDILDVANLAMKTAMIHFVFSNKRSSCTHSIRFI